MRNLFALLLIALASPAVAQDRLPLGSQVRLALPHGEMLEGRLVSGDSTSLNVYVRGTGTMVVPRERILLLTASTGQRGNRAAIAALTTGGIFALLTGAGTAKCNPRDCRPDTQAMTKVGLIGAGLGALVGAASQPVAWRAFSKTAPVGGRTVGIEAAKSCSSSPALEARVGVSAAGSRTGSAAITPLCAGNMALGAEVGSLRELSWSTNTFENLGNSYYTTLTHSEDRSAYFAGVLGSLAIEGPVDTRVIVSAGRYRRSDAITTSSYGYNQQTYYPTEITSRQAVSSWHPGVSGGLALATQVSTNLSFGITGRTHFLSGFNGGMITTVEATVRIRP